ncbi:MAG: hypothetical protein ACO3DK_08655, partial [Bacteroidia bacterium]
MSNSLFQSSGSATKRQALHVAAMQTIYTFCSPEIMTQAPESELFTEDGKVIANQICVEKEWGFEFSIERLCNELGELHAQLHSLKASNEAQINEIRVAVARMMPDRAHLMPKRGAATPSDKSPSPRDIFAEALKAELARQRRPGGLLADDDRQCPSSVPPKNCKVRLQNEGKPYPKSDCEACGTMSPLWRECRADLEKGSAERKADHVVDSQTLGDDMVRATFAAHKAAMDQLRTGSDEARPAVKES